MPIDLTSDFEVLVATLSGEAEGETLAGKQAIAASIMNRVAQAKTHPHFGDGTVRGACLAHMQYDCWLPGPDYDRIIALDLTKPSAALQDCIGVAKAAIAGTLADLTHGSTYYYAPSIPGPAWLAGARWCGVFGTQLFWRGVK
jgi:spore germination cell wall hydrolase CwlJ-like protein